MSKNAFFILALERLKINTILEGGDKISNELFITNNRDVIKEHTIPDFESIIGSLEYNHLFKCETIVYGFHEVEYGDEILHQHFITYNIRQIQNFLTSLWLSYDNAVDFNIAFLQVKASNSVSFPVK